MYYMDENYKQQMQIWQYYNQGLTIPGQIPHTPIFNDPNTITSDVWKITFDMSEKLIECGAIDITAYIDYCKSELYLTAIRLPAPHNISRQYCTYKVWLIDSENDEKIRLDLLRCVAGIDITKYRSRCSLRNFKEIVITAEKTPMVCKPTGAVVARADLSRCI